MHTTRLDTGHPSPAANGLTKVVTTAPIAELQGHRRNVIPCEMGKNCISASSRCRACDTDRELIDVSITRQKPVMTVALNF